MYNKWAKYTHKGITLLCDASPLKKITVKKSSIAKILIIMLILRKKGTELTKDMKHLLLLMQLYTFTKASMNFIRINLFTTYLHMQLFTNSDYYYYYSTINFDTSIYNFIYFIYYSISKRTLSQHKKLNNTQFYEQDKENNKKQNEKYGYTTITKEGKTEPRYEYVTRKKRGKIYAINTRLILRDHSEIYPINLLFTHLILLAL